MKVEAEFEDVLADVKSYLPEEDVQEITKAWKYALQFHAGQMRKSGDPYITHPLAVARSLVEWRLDATSVIAGILHDVIEDTSVTKEDIEKHFGRDVTRIVEGVTKVTDIRLGSTRKDTSVENLRKLILVMAKDIRVILVKLADRLHNMQTLSVLSHEKQIENAKETLEIYAPLAERLGIGHVKGELQDLAFPFIYKDEYKKVKQVSKEEYQRAQKHIKKMKQTLYKSLKEEKIEATIHGRQKHLYSLWKKLNRKGIDGDFSKIYDIVALRILVPTKADCYTALGVVHEHYRPSPSHPLSDYIASPKPNGYQSLHTKVFGPGSRIVEVQIRTHEMHRQAEYGVAAHWAYSDKKAEGNLSDSDLEKKGTSVAKEKLNWVRELARWQDEIKDEKKFMNAVKFDALNHRIFVFSPRGDVYDLPSGASPLDFAAAVHTDLIKYIKTARVNGKIVSLAQPLLSGDVVEIIKTKHPRKPGKDWYESARSHLAKREIAALTASDSGN